MKRKDIVGIALIVFGVYTIVVNSLMGAQCEYVSHQIYFALQEIIGWIAVLIGILVYKID